MISHGFLNEDDINKHPNNIHPNMRLRANKIFTCAPTVGCFGIFFLRVIVRSEKKQAKRAESSIQLGAWMEDSEDYPLNSRKLPLKYQTCHGTFILAGARVGIPVIHVFFLSYSFLENHYFYIYTYICIFNVASDMIWSPSNFFVMFFLWQKSMCWERIPTNWCCWKENVFLIAIKFC